MTRGNARQWLLCAALGGTARARLLAPRRRRRKSSAACCSRRPTTSASAKKPRASKRIFDEDGDLIPSEQSVAGLILPRGLTPADAPRTRVVFPLMEIPAEALERYFVPACSPRKINHSQGGATEFVSAKISRTIRGTVVTIRIVKLAGANAASELYIRQAVPSPLMRPEAIGSGSAARRLLREHAE